MIKCKIFGNFVEKTAKIPLYNMANWKTIQKRVDDEIKNNNIENTILTSSNIEQILSKTTCIIQEASNLIPVRERHVWQKRFLN